MAPATEPLPASLIGRAPSRLLRRHWLAMRPAFFPASVLPVIIGSAWGHAVSGHFDWTVATLALLATALVQGGANVINDVGDEVGGSDRANADRIFPYTGGSRFIQNEIMTVGEMARFGTALLGAAALIGVALALLRGPTVIWLGVVGVALGTLYSLPPIQLQGRGIGEFVIATAFGVMPVMGAAWLQSGAFDGAAALISIPIAMWVTAILLINEVPDIAADAQAGKRTLPVRVGARGTRWVYAALQLVAFAASALAVYLGLLHWIAIATGLPLLLLGLQATRGIEVVAGSRPGLVKSIERTLLIHTVGGIAITIAAWLSPLAAAR